jgi:hypothetical protein
MCKITTALTEELGQENAENLVGMISRVKARAIERGNEQDIQIVINMQGHVKQINGSDRIKGAKPKMYASE